MSNNINNNNNAVQNDDDDDNDDDDQQATSEEVVDGKEALLQSIVDVVEKLDALEEVAENYSQERAGELAKHVWVVVVVVVLIKVHVVFKGAIINHSISLHCFGSLPCVVSNGFVDTLKAVDTNKDMVQMDVPLDALFKTDEESNNLEACSSELLQRCRQAFSELETRSRGITLIRDIIDSEWKFPPTWLGRRWEGYMIHLLGLHTTARLAQK
jgi:hypothetical protein